MKRGRKEKYINIFKFYANYIRQTSANVKKKEAGNYDRQKGH